MGGSGGGAAVLPGGPDHHERPPGERDARAGGKNAVAGAGGAAVLPGAPDHHERAPGRDNNGACPARGSSLCVAIRLHARLRQGRH